MSDKTPQANKSYGIDDFEYPYRNEEWMRHQYWNLGKTTNDIAEICDIDRSNVVRWMDRLGIETRDVSDYDGHELTKKARESVKVNRANFRTSYRGYETWRSYNSKRDKNETVKVHRLLAVAEYGFDAVKGNIVHHKNGIKWDNRPENIEPMDETEHLQQHYKEREIDSKGRLV
jgi:hypothetical protein